MRVRPRGLLTAVASIPAAAALSLLLAGSVSAARSRPQASRPATATVTSLQRVTFSSPSNGVGLFVRSTTAQGGAGRGQCTFFTRPTTDGGARFGAASAPIRTTGCASGGGVAGVVRDGGADLFAYGPGLVESRDGGRRWHGVRLGGRIVALAAVGRSVWALGLSGCADTCVVTLFVSSDGGRSWRAASDQPPERRVPAAPAAAQLSDSTWLVRSTRSAATIVLPPASGSSAAQVEQTSDGAGAWMTAAAPCVADPFAVDAAVAPTGAQWIACAGQPGTGEQAKSVARSLDGGRTWRLASSCRLGTRCPHGVPLGGELTGLAAVSGSTAFYVGARSALTATRDGGRSWTAEPGFSGDASGTSEVAFVDPRDGWAIDDGFGGHAALWRTRDGGARWIRLTTAAGREPATPRQLRAFVAREHRASTGRFTVTYRVGGWSSGALRRVVVTAAHDRSTTLFYRETPSLDRPSRHGPPEFHGIETFWSRHLANAPPGIYSCDQPRPAAPWSCQGPDTQIGMGGMAELESQDPPMALDLGLQNAVESYTGALSGTPGRGVPAFLRTRRVDGERLRCIAFGVPAHRRGSVCLRSNGIIATYDLPDANITNSAYTAATLLAYSPRVTPAASTLPAPPTPPSDAAGP